jgi:hypothetical protein
MKNTKQIFVPYIQFEFISTIRLKSYKGNLLLIKNLLMHIGRSLKVPTDQQRNQAGKKRDH